VTCNHWLRITILPAACNHLNTVDISLVPAASAGHQTAGLREYRLLDKALVSSFNKSMLPFIVCSASNNRLPSPHAIS
jgi:hypothetical protein